MSLSKFLATIDGNRLTAFDLIAMRNGVPPKRLHEFWSWCFGDDYKTLRPSQLPDRWNNMRSDIMIVLPSHSVEKTIKLMSAIFMTK